MEMKFLTNIFGCPEGCFLRVEIDIIKNSTQKKLGVHEGDV